MKMRLVLSLSCLFAALTLAGAADEKEAPKTSAFEKMKGLAGDWVGKMSMNGGKDEMDASANYKVTSGNSVVVETLAPGTTHEMVTVIHEDGKDLILTHYCAAGNQPTMKADSKSDGDKISFKFLRATNLKSDKDLHMHDVVYTLVDKDTLKADWTHYVDGKAAGTASFVMKRKK